MMTRREILTRILALTAWSTLNPTLFYSPNAVAKSRSEGRVFSKEWLKAEAKRMSLDPYAAADEKLPVWLANLDWDGYQSIKFRPEKALWRGEGLPFQTRLFHLGLYFKHPVIIHEVVHGIAHPIPYFKELFQYGVKVDVPSQVGDLGFAGFRVGVTPDFDADMFAFLGASYFRAVGGTKQYGLSARGLAVDTGFNRPEEFPEFRQFWLERPSDKADFVTIHALLDSSSVTGAYTFVVTPGETTVMQIEAHLFPRRPIERLGIAPLTSMFQHGEDDRRVADDFRPEVHDSDGLALWTGANEWIWRPLVNSPYVRVNSFFDENPRGFGLLQRDRNFDRYQDDGANFDKRPSLWVEPLSHWGKGAVQLVEIPTADEAFDNTVVFWNPQIPVQPFQELTFNYRLHWGSVLPARPGVAEVIATRLGAIPWQKEAVSSSRLFIIDFQGGSLSTLPFDTQVEAVITASRGRIVEPAARPIISGPKGYWRCSFYLISEGKESVDLRCYLRKGQEALTETWLYQWMPAA